MAVNPQKRRTRGKRAGSADRAARQRDIHSRLDGRPSGTSSNHSHNVNGNVSNFKATAMDREIYYEGGEVETRETHIVPRRSLTDKQLLRVFPQDLETEPIVTRQLSASAKNLCKTVDQALKYMIETTDERLTWKSDKSLLNRTPIDKIGTFKREGSVSVGLNKRKQYTTQNEDQANITPNKPVTPDRHIRVETYKDNISIPAGKTVVPDLDF